MMDFTSATTDYISLGQPSALNFLPNTEWTVMCWAKSINASSSGTFFCKGDTSSRLYQMTYGGSSAPYNYECMVAGQFYDAGVVGGDGNWHHCVLRNYNTGTVYNFQMWADGAQIGTDQSSAATYLGLGVDVLLGARRATVNTGSGFLLSGSLDDVRFYNRAVSQAEIQTIYYARGNDAIMYGMVGWYRLNEAAKNVTASGAGVVKDVSSTLNTGTPSGSPKYNESILRLKQRYRH